MAKGTLFQFIDVEWSDVVRGLIIWRKEMQTQEQSCWNESVQIINKSKRYTVLYEIYPVKPVPALENGVKAAVTILY